MKWPSNRVPRKGPDGDAEKRPKARGSADPAPLGPRRPRPGWQTRWPGWRAALEIRKPRLAALKTLVTPDPQDPDWDVHLMAALGALSHPAIPALLAALFGEARDKVRRKALKKTLHLLKTRGVAVPAISCPRKR